MKLKTLSPSLTPSPTRPILSSMATGWQLQPFSLQEASSELIRGPFSRMQK